MLYHFLMEKVRPEMESLRKTGSKTVLLFILVTCVMIENIADLPDEM